MTICDTLRERMPDVALGRASWTEAERLHLAGCADCAREWRVVAAGSVLGQQTVVDVSAISERLLARLRDEAAAPAVRRLPWRGAGIGIGLLAAAASVAILIGGPAIRFTAGTQKANVTSVALLPELERLTESQLESVLSELDLPDVSVSPMRLPRLGDLTETQLEQLLLGLEG